MLRNSRREFLASAAATALASAKPGRLIIDTHLEVWTFDPKFPFHHPERPDLKRVELEGPIENEVQEMHDFGLTYTVLVNPRFYGWDNSYVADCLRRYPKLLVGHGLLDPLQPDPAGRLRYWVREHGLQGMRFSPIYHPISIFLIYIEDYQMCVVDYKLVLFFYV